MSKQELTAEQSRIVADVQQELKAQRTVETPRGRTKTVEVETKTEDETKTRTSTEKKTRGMNEQTLQTIMLVVILAIMVIQLVRGR